MTNAERRLFEGLVEMYDLDGTRYGRYTGAVFVAKLCDEHLDRSGALLGRVRDAARVARAAIKESVR